jgi:hypothetical protein
MSCFFQNNEPPPPLFPPCAASVVAGGGQTRRVERGVGGQYFGRRKTQLCTLPQICQLFRSPKIDSLESIPGILESLQIRALELQKLTLTAQCCNFLNINKSK